MRGVFILCFMCCATCLKAQLSINELSPKGGVMNMGENEDWLELINTGSEAVFLGDYFLSDDAGDLEQWGFPSSTLEPDELLLILATGNDQADGLNVWQSLVLAENFWRYYPASAEPPANWNLAEFDDSNWEESQGGFGYADGDDLTQVEGFPSIYLRRTFQVTDVSAITELILHADYDDAFVAYINGTEIARSFNMAGFPPAFDSYASMYTEASLTQGQIPEAHSLTSDLVQSLLLDGDNLLAIQVNNVSAESSDMSSNFFLSASLTEFDSNYQPIPEWFEQQVGSALLETNFKLSTGETVFITHESGSIVESILIPENLSTGLSYGREADDMDTWCYFNTPSPAQINGFSWCYNGITAEPFVNMPSGWYAQSQILTATSPFNVVRYSINGDIPTLDSPIYSESVIDENVSYTFRAFSQQNLLPSQVIDRTYVFDEDNHGLPVFSIHTAHNHLWDWEEGIYVYGPNADNENFPYFGSNFWEPWSKYSRLEYFNGEQELRAEEQFDLEIHGGWSRAFDQKSFRLDFKSIYSGNLEESLFSEKQAITEVNNINLRNGGQHVWGNKIQDGLFSRIVKDLHLDRMAYEPCLLYLNGEFWGVYGIREKMDEHYVESNHGVNSSSIDLLNRDGALEGTDDHFLMTHQLIMNTSAESSEFYEMVNGRIDVQNYIDYFIAQTYFQNKDWMGIAWGLNNVKLWRPQTLEGRWRYMMYDLDFGFGFLWGTPEQNLIEEARNPLYPSAHSAIFDKLLTNEQFKCEFAQRYSELLNTTFLPENFTETCNLLEDQMTLAMNIQADRWAENITIAQWLEALEQVEIYNEQRVLTARTQLNESLELGGESVVTFNVSPVGSGSIQISSVEPESFPWTGMYFNSCPVQIIATPSQGYEFDSWSANGIITEGSEDEVLLENLFQDDLFQANFIAVDSINSVSSKEFQAALEVFPNPTQGETTLRYNSSLIEELDIKVLDGLGREVYTNRIPKLNKELRLDIDLSPFQKGIYVVEVTSSSQSFSRRVALQ
ncbi:MAG: CotH kinase family protein [Flavobacteriales bacterium]